MKKLRRQWDFDFRDSPWDSEYFSSLLDNVLMDFGGGGGVPDYGSVIANASNQAARTEEDMYRQTRADLMPGIEAYSKTVPYLSSLLGIPGYDKIDPTQTLRGTPGYEWALSQGIGALNTSDAATGNLYSGAHQKGIVGYGTGLADQTYQSYLGNLIKMMGGGQAAAGTAGQFGMQAAGQMGQDYMSGADAIASNMMAQYNAKQQGQNSLFSLLGMGAGMLTAPFGGSSLLGKGASYLFE